MLTGTLNKLKFVAIAAITLLVLIVVLRNGETVDVGGGGGLDRMIKITVLQSASGRVKLGFDVDRDISVHREEVWQRMCASGELQEGIDYVKPT